MHPLLVDKDYVLQKFDSKGGWTYAEIPEIPLSKENAFGMIKVRGMIDGYEFSNFRLMPIGNGNLMIAVKADIRKKIGKQAGDTVRIILYADTAPVDIPEELVICLKGESGVWNTFETYSDGEKKAFIEWVMAAKTDQTKVQRIAKTIDLVMVGKKLNERTNEI